MYGITRATATVLGAAAAGFLLWLATQVGDTTTGGYWARYGIVAGAGLVLALSQLLGGWTKWGMPTLARPVFLFAFVPALIVVGWILLFHEPGTTWFSRHAVSWSGDLGIDGFVNDLGAMLPALALGLGLVFGLSFDTAGPRVREVPVETYDQPAVAEPPPAPMEQSPPPPVEEPVDAPDEPAVDAPAEPTYAAATAGEPEPEAAPRNEPPA